MPDTLCAVPAPWYPPLLDKLLAVAAAELDADGVLLAANAGFLHLLPAPGTQFMGQPVGRFFVQPSFQVLAGGDHTGLFTVGEAHELTRSLRGSWRCVQGRFQWLAEHNIEELERLSAVLLEINEKYQLTQQALAVTNKQLRRREAEVLALSHSDALTGVGNRRYLDAALQQEVTRALQTGRPLSVVMADFDHFKAVNDTHGHIAGDTLLRHIADHLSRTFMRRYDVVARYGGDEFCVLLRDTTAAEAKRLLARAAAAIAAPANGVKVAATLSIGVVDMVLGDTPASLLERADKALYRAKEAGRNTIVAGS
jgi:diguanylate cyclase (GGDEF)-like protein